MNNLLIVIITVAQQGLISNRNNHRKAIKVIIAPFRPKKLTMLIEEGYRMLDPHLV